MVFKQIKSAKELSDTLDMFGADVKLVSAEYVACQDLSEKNDVRSAILTFKGKSKFQLKFTEIDCVHLAPVTFGSIFLADVSLGQFRNLFFWADSSEFNISMPDSSLSYVVAKGLWVAK